MLLSLFFGEGSGLVSSKVVSLHFNSTLTQKLGKPSIKFTYILYINLYTNLCQITITICSVNYCLYIITNTIPTINIIYNIMLGLKKSN